MENVHRAELANTHISTLLKDEEKHRKFNDRA